MKILNRTSLIIILAVFLLLGGIFFLWRNQRIIVETDKKEYSTGEEIKIKIKNYFLNKELCFSSCYPYFFEKEKDGWQGYLYDACPFPDRVEKCIKPGQVKAFSTFLPKFISGRHRLAVSVCDNCAIGQDFKATAKFFSNEFEIR